MSRFEPKLRDAADPSELMRNAIDSPQGRRLYCRRIASVEQVFANIRRHKRMHRFTPRGRAEVTTKWPLYCLAQNIERIVRYRYQSGWPARAARGQ